MLSAAIALAATLTLAVRVLALLIRLDLQCPLLNLKADLAELSRDLLYFPWTSDDHCDGRRRIEERREVLLERSKDVVLGDVLVLLQKVDRVVLRHAFEALVDEGREGLMRRLSFVINKIE